MKVKNNVSNPIAIGATVIPGHSTEEVGDWEDYKDRYGVKKLVEAGVLSPSSTESVESAADVRVATTQELDRLKVDYKKTAKTDDLVALLTEKKAQLAKDGQSAT